MLISVQSGRGIAFPGFASLHVGLRIYRCFAGFAISSGAGDPGSVRFRREPGADQGYHRHEHDVE